MAGTPQILVLGVHRLEFDESGVEGHLETFCPPYGPELRAMVREMLQSTVGVELLVAERDERFDAYAFRQPGVGEAGSWFHPEAPVCVWYLRADGEQVLEFDDNDDDDAGPVPPMDIETFRVVVYLRGWDETKPLLSSSGELPCPKITDMPERLSRIAPYWSGD